MEKIVVNSNLKYSPAQYGDNHEPTRERKCPEEQFKKGLDPPEKVSDSLDQASNWEHLGKVTIANVWRTLQIISFGWFLPL